MEIIRCGMRFGFSALARKAGSYNLRFDLCQIQCPHLCSLSTLEFTVAIKKGRSMTAPYLWQIKSYQKS